MTTDYVRGIVRRVEVADESGALAFDLERLGQPPLHLQVGATVAADGYCIPDMPVLVYFDGSPDLVTRVAEDRPW
jgi:hypothetical protein